MITKFTAFESVEISVNQCSIPIRHYLRQPQRLVNALADHTRIEQLSAEVFRLKMRPLSFMSLSIQPTVDMRVWADTSGTIYLRSLRCEILGFEYINQRFDLNLKGYLSPVEINNGTSIQGKADLEILVDIPQPFSLTPKSILEATGNGLLKSVLLTIKQRLLHHLLTDYHHWMHQATKELETDHPSTDSTIPNADLITTVN